MSNHAANNSATFYRPRKRELVESPHDVGFECPGYFVEDWPRLFAWLRALRWRRVVKWLVIIELVQIALGVAVGATTPWLFYLTGTGWYAHAGENNLSIPFAPALPPSASQDQILATQRYNDAVTNLQLGSLGYTNRGAVVPDPYAKPLTKQQLERQAKDDAEWRTRCVAKAVVDQYMVTRYVYSTAQGAYCQ